MRKNDERRSRAAGEGPRFALLLAAILVLSLAAYLASRPAFLSNPHNNDFVAYWAAGRLTLDGGNPYGAADLMRVEQSVGWGLPTPLMLWNPPWMLSVLLAFAPLSYTAARSIWLVLQLGLSLGCGLALWRFYDGPRNKEVWTVVLTVLFAPLAMSLKYGQIGPLCLLGLTGFLLLQGRRRDFWAGAMLSLAAMKPHLVYMVWPAVLVWSIAAGRWRVLVGLALAGLALAVVPAVVNPHVYADFLRMMREPPPPEFAGLFITKQDSPTIGWQLRLLFGKDRFALQYVPTMLGLVWLAWYGCRHRRGWDWAERLPVLLLVSIATAAYGAWPADSLLLLPAVMVVAGGVARRGHKRNVILAMGVLVMLSLLTYRIESGPTTESYVIVPPLYLAAYFWFHSRSPIRERTAG